MHDGFPPDPIIFPSGSHVLGYIPIGVKKRRTILSGKMTDIMKKTAVGLHRVTDPAPPLCSVFCSCDGIENGHNADVGTL